MVKIRLGPFLDAFSHGLCLATELVLPASCILCGRPLALEAASQPLCPACLSLLRPIQGPACPRCGKGLISEAGPCMRCRGKSWSFDEARPLFAYRGEAAGLIAAYKFGGRRSLSGFFASLAAREVQARWPGRPIVPVPFRSRKIRERGWDQVEEIARRLERGGMRVMRILERLPSGEQKKLGLEDRFENARRAYRLKGGALVPGELVLLDDVFTTGATAEACARELKEGGARAVAFLSIAAD